MHYNTYTCLRNEYARVSRFPLSTTLFARIFAEDAFLRLRVSVTALNDVGLEHIQQAITTPVRQALPNSGR